MIRYHVEPGLEGEWLETVRERTSVISTPIAGELRLLKVSFFRQAFTTDDTNLFICKILCKPTHGEQFQHQAVNRDGRQALIDALVRTRREVIRSLPGDRLRTRRPY